MKRLSILNSRCFLVWLCALLLTSLCGPAFASDSNIAALQKEADTFYTQRENLPDAYKAIELYQKILKSDPDHELAYVRLAKLYVWVGYHEGEVSAIYDKAVKVAEEAVKRYPERPGPCYWLGVTYGLKAGAPDTGSFTSLSLLDPIQEQMDRLIKMDPAYEYGGAWRVLGRMKTKVPYLLGGDKDLAVKYLRKAIKMGPQFYLNHLYLADVLDKLDEREEAIALLQQVLKGKPLSDWEPETKLWQRTALKALSQSARLEERHTN